jgi:hypothetical protein
MTEFTLIGSTTASNINGMSNDNTTITGIKIGEDEIIIDNNTLPTIPDSLKNFFTGVSGGSLVNKTKKRKRIRKKRTRGKR